MNGAPAPQLHRLPQVGKVQSIFDIFPESDPEKLKRVHKVAKLVERKLQFGNRPSKAEQVAVTLRNLDGTLEKIQEKLFAAGSMAGLEAAVGVISAGMKKAYPEPNPLRSGETAAVGKNKKTAALCHPRSEPVFYRRSEQSFADKP